MLNYLHPLPVAFCTTFDGSPQYRTEFARAIIDECYLTRASRNSFIHEKRRGDTPWNTAHLSMGIAHHQQKIISSAHLRENMGAQVARQSIYDEIAPIFPQQAIDGHACELMSSIHPTQQRSIVIDTADKWRACRRFS